MLEVVLAVIGVAAGAGVTLAVTRLMASRAPETVAITGIAERLRTAGKLVGLEVSAKEIATSTKGWDWMPPILLSPARLAMIFHFEQQYYVDLSRLGPADLEAVPSGRLTPDVPRKRLRLPAVESSLRLNDLEPYDIQAGRVLGLVDVIPMGAARQKGLMRSAQDEASRLFRNNDERYRAAARASIERQLRSLMAMAGVEIEVVWKEVPADASPRLPAAPAPASAEV